MSDHLNYGINHGTDPAVEIDYALVEEIRAAVNRELEDHETSKGKQRPADQREMAKNLIMRELEDRAMKLALRGEDALTADQEMATSVAVIARMFGMGRLEGVLNIPDVEDIYVCGSDPITVKFFGGEQQTFPPIAESDEDLREQVQAIATHHGQDERTISTASPFLNIELPGKDARLAFMYGVTPRPIVTIRRHRYINVTLDDLVAWGTISRPMMALLQAAVMGRKSILVVGPQSAGKTTMLRALAACIAPEERFATMETEYELLLHTIPGRFPLVLPIQERMGTGDKDASGASAGEISLADVFPWTLRHSIKRILVGEVRSDEVLPMMRAMSRGLRGSMATFHVDSAREAFESLASLLTDYRPALTREAAMRQIAAALDFVVFIDAEKGLDPVTGMPTEQRYVSDILQVGNVADAATGVPATDKIFTAHKDAAVREHDPRGYPTGTPLTDDLWARRAGLDPKWLSNTELGEWDRPFLQRDLA